ncbi:lanthionine synthetase C family protein [Streptomyces albipurpureus]|uniref:Lanthionine synthetase C family protein n=1 Tax=Streptomyces albipurpureus TaxID=2897419 RepID=A0ABT0UTI5_9ACTN|nr:lanthionine synthetase C family protein [Streptomyces sp. CWNU-1]MCM2391894.1 lanthionine synthetase C family protein [Streptomyces sp. CWNU-1]
MLSLTGYERFALADADVYEAPQRIADTSARLPAADRPPPPGWDRDETGWWVTWRPGSQAAPDTPGWRIVVSGIPTGAARAVEIVAGHCVDRRYPFAFPRSATAVRMLNADHGSGTDRAEAGTVAVIAPPDEAALADSLRELAVLLDALPGPRILSGLPYGHGPLHIRHGALVTDPRTPLRPSFTLPDGVTPPVRVHAPPVSTAPDGFPYAVEAALRLTPGGGVYRAVHQPDGTPVVLREARPYAGIDRHGQDAVTRLRHRTDALARLAGLDCVPQIVDTGSYGGHVFLATRHLTGAPLLHAATSACPLTSETRAREEAPGYADWAVDILDRVAAALDAVLARGLLPPVLHPRHILLRPDGGIALTGPFFTERESVRWMMAGHRSEAGHAERAFRGPAPDVCPDAEAEQFTVPAHLRGAHAARYLLAALRLWLFLPVPHHRCPGRLRTLADAVQRHYPLPQPPDYEPLLPPAVGPPAREPARDPAAELFAGDPPDWPALRDALVHGIHTTATPDRPDRLFPSTPTGPDDIGGPSFGHGAAGVLYALHRSGARIPREYTDWLTEAAERSAPSQAGFYDGVHGIAYTLDLIGRRDAALELLDRCHWATDRALGPDLERGEAGIALTLLHFARATGEQTLLDEALERARRLVALIDRGPLPTLPGHHPPHGLLHGPAGIALLLLRLYEHLGDTGLLTAARRALDLDLARCRTLADHTVMLDDGARGLPYLQGGSAGAGLVLHQLLRHRPDPRAAALLDGIRRTCAPVHVHNSGLLRGRAGVIATLAALGEPPVAPDAPDCPERRHEVRRSCDAVARPLLNRQIRRLGWHARLHQGALVFPGYRLLRLSADLATGSAGVLLALNSALAKGDRTCEVLPFLGTRPRPYETEKEV